MKIPRTLKVTSLSDSHPDSHTKEGLKGEWMIPRGAPEEKVILYLHGGGYCLGLFNANRSFAARMAHKCSRKLFLADYRLAPEFPYPAALEDAVSALTGLYKMGYKPENCLIAADSSGCGLTLAALLKLKEEKIEMPGALVLLCPMLDLTYSEKHLQHGRQKIPCSLTRTSF